MQITNWQLDKGHWISKAEQGTVSALYPLLAYLHAGW